MVGVVSPPMGKLLVRLRDLKERQKRYWQLAVEKSVSSTPTNAIAFFPEYLPRHLKEQAEPCVGHPQPHVSLIRPPVVIQFHMWEACRTKKGEPRLQLRYGVYHVAQQHVAELTR